jgi:hypothetical protein
VVQEVAAALAAVDRACRAAVAADEQRPAVVAFEQTGMGRIVHGAPGPDGQILDTAAVALWVHDALAATARGGGPSHRILGNAADVLSEGRVVWSGPALRWALARSRHVLQRLSAHDPYLVGLPLAIAERMPAGEGQACGAWRWFADRTDLWYSSWEVARMRRRMERLLPPVAGDPYRALPTACPLADRLRARLGPRLGQPAVVALLHHCQGRPYGAVDARLARRPGQRAVPVVDRNPYGGQEMRQWWYEAAGMAAGHAAVLRTIGQTALAHQPIRYPVMRRGRLVRRMVWAEPATLLLLYGAVATMATAPWTWVDDLLTALGAKTVAVHPARRGRRALLARAAHDALAARGAATSRLTRLLREAAQPVTACYCIEPAACPHRQTLVG